MTGFLICSQIISQIRRLRESIEEVLDVDFGSAGDDNLQPLQLRNTCGCASQKPQEGLGDYACCRIRRMRQ